ncbi:hypothetical protein [Nocardia farcinica]|uniref:hypothetical protein n=1 Tax=Nocardia farcinica TaxID=37329 RepID=UPI00378FC409
MTSAEGVNIEVGVLRAHAATVTGTIEGVPKAREAADYLGHVDDGYGLLVGPYARSILNPLHDRISERLRVLVEETGAIPPKLCIAADQFQALEEERAKQLAQQGEQIDRQG